MRKVTTSKRSGLNRREFLQLTATGGAALVLGFYLPGCARHGGREGFAPNAWLRITPDDQITVLVEIPEMGQGPRTVDTMMLADELEADWSHIRVEQAPVISTIYQNLATGGSGGTGSAWDYMRKVGAQGREVLLAAAAKRWNVPKEQCRAQNSTVVHQPSGRTFSYGQLVETASGLPVPAADKVPLKDPKDFRLIGKSAPRVDVPAKVTGSAAFGIDVRTPGMLFAVIARCPYFGGKLQSFDATQAKAVPGVRDIFAVPPLGFHPGVPRKVNTAGGVAVVAESTWAAMRGRRALKISWDKGPHAGESTDSIRKLMHEGASAPPSYVAVNQGDATSASQNGTRSIEATYELPFQAHATMEPMNTTVYVRNDGIEVWSPTQIGTLLQEEMAGLSGLAPSLVKVHMMHGGGSFGRRYMWDYGAEAFQVAQRMRVPVQLLWTREDDMTHDFYRPYSYHRLTGALDRQGNIVAWSHRIVSTPIRAIFDPPEELTPQRLASQELGGADVLPYRVANFRLDYVPVLSGVPRAWWRSVASSFNGFALESFVDELAHAAGMDPYLYRMALLKDDREVHNARAGREHDTPLSTRRFRNVLQLAAESAGWGKPMPKGYGRGIACLYSFDSYLAHVAEVSVDRDGNVRVHRVVSAVDCATAVNLDGVKAMTEGAINFALTQVLGGEITIKDGAVEQDNFDGYNVLRMNSAPEVEVHILPTPGEPGGMGETGIGPLAPAVANAVFAATGKRVRRLPIDPAMFSGHAA